MRVEDLSPASGSRKERRRVGRGNGSGRGNQCGRGTKGQRARSGVRMVPGFEGGQTPMWKRLPKRGFNSPARKEYSLVNLDVLNEKYEDKSEVTPQNLREKGLVQGRRSMVKILGRGKLERSLVVRAHRFSSSAIKAIEEAGGEAIRLR